MGRPGASAAAPIFTARIGRPSSDAPMESTWISVSAAAQAARVARMPVPGLSNERNTLYVSAAVAAAVGASTSTRTP